MSINDKSRYSNSVLIKEHENYYISGRDYIDPMNYEDNISHIWAQGDRLDLLAKRYYGDHTLWWIIADFNNIMYFFEKIDLGTRLAIPSFTRVVTEIL